MGADAEVRVHGPHVLENGAVFGEGAAGRETRSLSGLAATLPPVERWFSTRGASTAALRQIHEFVHFLVGFGANVHFRARHLGGCVDAEPPSIRPTLTSTTWNAVMRVSGKPCAQCAATTRAADCRHRLHSAMAARAGERDFESRSLPGRRLSDGYRCWRRRAPGRLDLAGQRLLRRCRMPQQIALAFSPTLATPAAGWRKILGPGAILPGARHGQQGGQAGALSETPGPQ